MALSDLGQVSSLHTGILNHAKVRNGAIGGVLERHSSGQQLDPVYLHLIPYSFNSQILQL